MLLLFVKGGFALSCHLQDLRSGHFDVAYSLPFDRLRIDGSMVLSDYIVSRFGALRAQNEKRLDNKVPLCRRQKHHLGRDRVSPII